MAGRDSLPPSPAELPFWHGDGLAARSIRFALTVMAPIAGGLLVGVDTWLIYAIVTSILAFALDTGGSPPHRFTLMAVAGLVVIVGTGVGTLAAGHVGLMLVAVAGAGALYALVESLDPSAAVAARFLCLTLAIGALFAPLDAREAGVVVAYAIYAWGVSIAWDLVTGTRRPSTAPSLAMVVSRLRATERERWVFAAAVAIAVPLALLTSLSLGLHRPYWTLIVVVIVLRADALSSRREMGQMLLGTMLGIGVALVYGYALPFHSALLAGMALAALIRWPAQQLNGALGAAALTAFIMLLLEFIAGGVTGASHDIFERFVDVAVGCGFAGVALALDRLGQFLLRRHRLGEGRRSGS
ncbi:FUSC family protein [Ancylobacter pratisalsi]|uniref:FUSC family protein n=1 Tax=Ancylobacter pratisalsi TaxID=1745854 RepID=A0A6P1YLY4_9HYPH|nr:FUSC family protein [Ancylobacter pratisalsi]QIB34378.1 FUSC family protein [Ancylobacter pratisalsi]